MNIAIFSTHKFERNPLTEANAEFKHHLTFFDERLSPKTVGLAKGFPCVSIFVGDDGSRRVLEALREGGTTLLALRSAGFNHVDLLAAKDLGITVLRVPAYSPYSVAEHAVALLQTLNRKIHKAYNRVREGNFSLDGLVGMDLHGKTIGVIGTGKIGQAFARIMRGFGCEVLASDPRPDAYFAESTGVIYTTIDDVLKKSDVVSLHVPLTHETFHLINGQRLASMRNGAILINTSRGGVIETKALIKELKSGRLGGAGLDVYEEEENFFFLDHSTDVMSDDVLARLMTFPNVILTGHQAFLTNEALKGIAVTTLQNVHQFQHHLKHDNEVIYKPESNHV